MIFPLSPPMFDLLILSITEQEDSYGYPVSYTHLTLPTT